nr:TRBV4.2 [Tiliqua rugosa]
MCFPACWPLVSQMKNCLEQSLPYVVVRKKDLPLSVTCVLKDASYSWLSWYVQNLQGQLHFLGTTREPGDMENSAWQGSSYSVERVSGMQLKLEVKNVTESQTIYCSCSEPDTYNSPLSFGEGTRLAVLESKDDISPPTVTIFDPSAQELQEKQKVTIVCLVTDFYPDHVNLTWSVDGDERTKGVKTKEPDLDKAAKKFSLISRLRITRKEWEKTKEIQCNVYFDPLKQNYTGTIRGQVCDGSDALKEPYLRSNNLGKLIYILLIFKSTLYGAFITGLMLRKKSMKEKPFA